VADFTIKMANPPLTVRSASEESVHTGSPTRIEPPESPVNAFSRLAHNDFFRLAVLAAVLLATVVFA
jgi:hypothetical protein